MNGYEADPCILITVFYFIRRLFEWIVSYRIHDWSIIFKESSYLYSIRIYDRFYRRMRRRNRSTHFN